MKCSVRSSLRNRRIALGVLAAVFVTAGGCTGGGLNATPVQPRAEWTLDHGGIVRGDASRRRITLIFTGGEHGEGTGFILDTLSEAGVKAAFFVTGDYIAKHEYHAHLRRIVANGHYLGPHSDSHPLYCPWEDRELTLVTREFFERDLRKNIADLRRFGAMPDGEPIYFIPPYEWYNADQVQWARAMGITLFNFTPGSGSNRDWIPESHAKFVSSERILRDVLAFERKEPRGLNGFLLLLHLGSQRAGKMHLKLPELIAELRERGYEFVGLDEMLR